MTESLYSILGLEKGATPGQVRRAFQRLAKLHHPDRGGDPGKMTAVNVAYQILSDPVRRLKYDIQGETRPTDPDAGARQLMLQALMEVIEGLSGSGDLCSAADRVISGLISKGKTIVASGAKKIHIREKVLKRLKFKGQSHDTLTQLLLDQIEGFKKNLAETEAKIDLAKRAKELLKDYEFEPESGAASSQSQSFDLLSFANEILGGRPFK